MKLIDKSALVAEIERRIENLYPKVGQGMIVTKILKDHYEDLLSFINTLEVKEMDLDFEIKEDWLFADKTEVDCFESMCLTEDMFVSLAKKYFKLGLKAQKGE